MFGKATDVAGDVVDKAKDVGGEAVDKAKDVGGDVVDKAKDVVDDVKDRRCWRLGRQGQGRNWRVVRPSVYLQRSGGSFCGPSLRVLASRATWLKVPSTRSWSGGGAVGTFRRRLMDNSHDRDRCYE